MPALPNVPNVIKLTLRQLLGDDLDVINRLYFQYTGSAPTSINLATAALHIGNDWATSLGAQLSNGLQLTQVLLEDLTSPTGGVGSNGAGHNGGGSCTPEPAGLALIISHHIARRYRGGHPRVYIAGMCEGHRTSPQTWDPTVLGNVVSAYQTFIGSVEADLNTYALTSSSSHCNVSYYAGFTNHTYPSGRVKAIPNVRASPLVDVVTAYVGNPICGSQRRRNRQSA